MFDSGCNKLQRVLCNETRILPTESMNQFAVRIKTVVKKYSLKTHDYKNKKQTKIFVMAFTPQK